MKMFNRFSKWQNPSIGALNIYLLRHYSNVKIDVKIEEPLMPLSLSVCHCHDSSGVDNMLAVWGQPVGGEGSIVVVSSAGPGCRPLVSTATAPHTLHQHQQPSLLLLTGRDQARHLPWYSWATHLSWVEILTLMSYFYEIIIGLRIPKMSSFIKYERHTILLCIRIRIQPPHQWQVWH